ncbi:MAG: hypothetical protein J7K62_03195 [Thermoplasmata archaeon]|nr:hypothetical protein [Thermoplasmata archaeon]
MSEKNKKPSQTIAVLSFLLNIFFVPGVGSLVGGRTVEGIMQLLLSFMAISLFLLKRILIGITIYFIVWVWALVTGILIIKESE